MTNLLRCTLNVQESSCQPQYTLQLLCKDHVLFILVDLHMYLCRQQHPKCKKAIYLVYPLCFNELHSLFNPTKKTEMELLQGIQTTLWQHPFKIRHMFIWTFFLTLTDTKTSQIIDLSSWTILYMNKQAVTPEVMTFLFLLILSPQTKMWSENWVNMFERIWHIHINVTMRWGYMHRKCASISHTNTMLVTSFINGNP